MSRRLRIWVLWDSSFQLLCFQSFSPVWVFWLNWTYLTTPQPCTAHLCVTLQPKGQHERVPQRNAYVVLQPCVQHCSNSSGHSLVLSWHSANSSETFLSRLTWFKGISFLCLMKKWKITCTQRNFDSTKSCISSNKDEGISPEQHKSKLFSCLQTFQPCLQDVCLCFSVTAHPRLSSSAMEKDLHLKSNDTHFLLFKKKKMYVKSGDSLTCLR